MPKQNIKQKIDVLNVRLPEDIVEWLDSLIESGVYSSRSELIRDILRDLVNSEDIK